MEIKIIQKTVKRKVVDYYDTEVTIAEVYVNDVLISANQESKYDKVGDMIATLLHGNKE